jgi:hypothetical protein
MCCRLCFAYLTDCVFKKHITRFGLSVVLNLRYEHSWLCTVSDLGIISEIAVVATLISRSTFICDQYLHFTRVFLKVLFQKIGCWYGNQCFHRFHIYLAIVSLRTDSRFYERYCRKCCFERGLRREITQSSSVTCYCHLVRR